ncbi:hypothetical protein AB6713_16125 [Luteimonas sp. B3_2_R+30]|uniref:Uncharacterized protein n=2 Tax=Luteimonas salinilitoris TaxID=3237697 RepID=A0ABV4HTP0_9GAMM
MTIGVAGSLSPPATEVEDQAASLPSRPEPAMERPRYRQPGFTVPGSHVGVPGRARASSTVEGRAPAGSRVEAAGQVVDVGGDLRFRLRIPADARGVMPVRVIRPDRTVLVLRVEIVHD